MVAPEDRNLPEQQEDELGVFGSFSDYTGRTTETGRPSKITDPRQARGGSEASKLSQILSGGMGGAFEEIDLELKPSAKSGAASALEQRGNVTDDFTVIYCRKYPEKVATSQCPQCQAYFCSEAMTIYKGKLVCVDCAENLRSLALGELSARQGIQAIDENQKREIIEDIPDFDPSGRADAGFVASPFKRGFAAILDIIFIVVLSIILQYILASNQGGEKSSVYFQKAIDAGLFKIWPQSAWNLLVAFGYTFLFSLINNRTWGMIIVGIRLVTIYGDYAGFLPSLIRTAVVLVTNILGWVFCFFNQYRQELCDMAAGTCLINYSGSRAVDRSDNIQIKTYD